MTDVTNGDVVAVFSIKRTFRLKLWRTLSGSPFTLEESVFLLLQRWPF